VFFCVPSCCSMPFPVDEAGLHILHGVDDEFHKAAVEDPVAVPEVVIRQHIPELSLAIAAGAHRYFGMDGLMQPANALRICSSFLRPETWKRQSGKLLPLMMANPLPPPQQ